MLKLLRPDTALRLREFFAGANYTSDQLTGRMGFVSLPSRRQRTLPFMLDKTREPGALNTLVRWFYIGVPVESSHARALIPDWLVSALLESGLIVAEAEQLVSKVRITPVEQKLILSDSAMDFESGLAADLVLWPNRTTRLLSLFTVRRPSRRTLDLGTGCGLQSIEAAAHSETVVAADISARSIEFAAFNARLNGVENVEFVTGDMFAPVLGQKFDLIVSNPPFFITPSNNYVFCDNGLDLDEFCRRLAREVSSYLNEDGYFQMLCEWAEVEGQPWTDRVVEWLRDTGCDAWVLKQATSDAGTYGYTRFRESAPVSTEGEDAVFEAWMDYYRQRKVVAVHAGLIAMRKRSGKNWIRIDDPAATGPRPFGDVVLRTFANRDFLQTDPSEEQLLALKPRMSPDAELDRQLISSENGWQLKSLNLRLTSGVLFSQPVQPLVAEFLAGCDGRHTLGELTEAMAAKVNASLDQVQRECLAVLRQLIERGFVLVDTAG